ITFKIFLGEYETSISSTNVGEFEIGDAHANTIISSAIENDAYYQTISGSTVGRIEYPDWPDPSALNPPISQAILDQFKANGDSGGVCGIPDGCDADGNFKLTEGQVADLGPKQILGSLDMLDRSELTITGTIHVLGDAKFKNSCVVKLDSSYGSKSGVLIVDGNIDINNKCQFLGSGNPDSYIAVISTSPDIKLPPAIRISDSSSGAILYAAEGGIIAENRVILKEIFGQKIGLENGSVVNYESGLANVNFSVGPSGAWGIENWEEIE